MSFHRFLALALAAAGPLLANPIAAAATAESAGASLPETFFRLPSDSMDPTFQAGSLLVVEPIGDTPRRDDVVTVRSPSDVLLVGRVVALPGEEVRLTDTQLLVNGKPVPDRGHPLEPFRARMAKHPAAGQAYVVPANAYYVIPDNWNDAVGSMEYGAADRSRIPHRVSAWGDVLKEQGKASRLLKAFLKPMGERLPVTVAPGLQLRAVEVLDDRNVKTTYSIDRQNMDALRGPRAEEFLQAIRDTFCQSPVFKVATGLRVRYQFNPEGPGEPLTIDSGDCASGR